MPEQPHLYHFYGRECPWCIKMHPLVDRLEHETKLKVVQLEVWHNEGNKKKLVEFADKIRPACGGRLAVPAFYNTETGKAICGAVDYETLNEWATEPVR